MKKYRPQEFESKWIKVWEEQPDPFQPTKEPKYYLVELPYTSGDLHIGHWFTFTIPDVLSRFKKMQGHDVFFPIGYDAFGLPAENAAMKRGVHPRDWTMANIETMTKQFKTMATMLNWEHMIIACEPEYYRWNQWIFLKMYEKGLAYRGSALSNWCEKDKTVLANEGIENGKCWRCGTEVVQKEIEQWFLKITDYADQLIWPENPEQQWPMSVRVGQNNWVGKSEGVELQFEIVDYKSPVTVFTTALDTIFGVTFLVLSPEHSIISALMDGTLKSSEIEKVKPYVNQAQKKTEEERKIGAKDKTGVFTSLYAVNPLNGQKIPVWVADYVLSSYGTGAVMGVPGHDARDHEFAQKFELPIVQVLKPADSIKDIKIEADGFWDYADIKVDYKDTAILLNSGEYDGLTSSEAKKKLEEYIQTKKIGEIKKQYHIHDWSISRQRYWGTPVPMIHCDDCGMHPVPEKDLPVELPYDVDFTPTGKPPLATNEEWMKVDCPKCGKPAMRDAETLDTFFDSAWYFYRYLSPHYTEGPFDTEEVKKKMPVDIYFGGSEHTLGHTLYARFFTKFFHDLGLVPFTEFADRRMEHGVILGPDGHRMSKSRGNVINPDDLVKEYGADTVRLYLCFMMPYEATAPWSTSSMQGAYGFLRKVWDIYTSGTYYSDEAQENADLVILLNKTIQSVTRDVDAIKMNTAIARMMELVNGWNDATRKAEKPVLSTANAKKFLQLLAPFAPLMTEEIWHQELGEKSSIHSSIWPVADKCKLKEATITMPVQVNGKMRATITVDATDVEEKAVVDVALTDATVKKYTDGKEYKVIYV
ncbi:MAG: leucine--tRNA ligase, partial [Weeksellaceae bacterium]